MLQRRREPTKIQLRLLKLIREVEDEDIKEIMIDVLGLEGMHRSAKNFPTRKVKDIVDRVARLQDDVGIKLE